MNLIAFYKQTIKELALQIKEEKKNMKTLMREGKPAGQIQWSLLGSKAEVRALYHAYAKVRGKDLSKLERNPKKPLEEDEIQKAEERMLSRFKAQSHEEVIA